ncbi:hypothetical protein PFAG_02570 [Plasmodium falciparum Santa Lucia]|uniref:Uncharacterized protein n=6 Tax=Plasmodium falciparum TaxID=5833 RepID=A0A024W842_PLAFA|nr:hypothetical protein PFFVO_02619 [Plasmodium falciparum Vietnam Oak-Knoll (FVO)]ETW36690.1 hypothetical protein PFTANZ_02648 [Plasmodium falciparum Tanzania (2000708)]ETW42848.1 hypothetical protein PFNF135_02742 [Plasmodium falciparum NF135/5.C10]ETW61482.1 hypothetical protein PFMC_02573 [Plasmodium falciparum CAMP/Malaysia]EUR72567.1 hypothetical protein PFBG_02658 [Plasmodium falciparum 7G8]EUT86111.1 hypothetical protein PFAG_02570 [Plasmodium falciparum Santa Lucia]
MNKKNKNISMNILHNTKSIPYKNKKHFQTNKFINYVYIEQKMLILINSFYAVLNWSEDFNNFSYHKYIINILFCL